MATTAAPADIETPARSHREKTPRNMGQAPWLVRIVLGLICFFWVVPVIGTFITSFRSEQDANATGWWTVITNPSLTFSNYKNVIVDADLGSAFINSLAITLPATFIPVLIAAFAAYAFTFMRFWGREFLFVMVVGLLVVPNYVSFVPILKIYANIGLAGHEGIEPAGRRRTANALLVRCGSRRRSGRPLRGPASARSLRPRSSRPPSCPSRTRSSGSRRS